MVAGQAFTLTDVTQDNVDRLRYYIEKYGGSVSGQTDGIVQNDCFTLDYRYSPTDRTLAVTPQKLIDVVTPAALRGSIQRLLELPASALQPGTTQATATTMPTPTNQSCGVYLWIYGYVANKTNLPLVLQGNYVVGNCVPDAFVNPIPPNTPITAASTPDFMFQGHKNTFNTGLCTVNYTVGQDTLTITFQMQDDSPPADVTAQATVDSTRFKTPAITDYVASYDAGAAASDLYIYAEIDNAS